jgi:diketogulonate reductase-like aldo/keto reductase
VLVREKPVSAEEHMVKLVINQIESHRRANDFTPWMKEQGIEVQGWHPFSKTKDARSKESPRRTT